MSKFLNKKYIDLIPYTPGEQPKDFKFIKLNTNESPFPPSSKAMELAKKELEKLNLYSDPTCFDLTKKASEFFNVNEEEVIFGNGSDELLYLSFLAFCDSKSGVAFADITYGFYSVYAEMLNLKYEEISLKEDYSIDYSDYLNLDKTIFIANPNAQTGIFLPVDKIEKIVNSNRNRVVVIDEAYVDFGGESCVPLTKKYDNLLVVQTFSKSRSLAGARLGVAIGNKELIRDLNTLRFSTNPYNINRMTMACGIGALLDKEYFIKNCNAIIENRAYTTVELQKLGFYVLDSKANFVLAQHERISGERLYLELKRRGILVRHFNNKRIENFNRITIGAKEQMEAFIRTIKEILEENKWELRK